MQTTTMDRLETKTIQLDDVVFRDDLYPRIEKTPSLVQQYAEHLDVLPPIEVNQHNELIDGWHRWTAHKKKETKTIDVIVTETASDIEFLSLAIRRNSKHGQQLSERDKRKMAIRLYNGGVGLDKAVIAEVLSVAPRSVDRYLTDIDRQIKDDRKQTIFDMWLACHTQQEIADEVGVSQPEIAEEVKESSELDKCPKLIKLSALHDDDFTPPLYDIWNFASNANETKHFGNTHVGIVDNLLYTFTKPFDIVIDPFAGGGSTIDICKKRLRRYWVSDRKPIPEREDIRLHDIKDGVSGPARWGDVALVYFDPPYWKQAEGKYSDDADDLANMTIDVFTKSLTDLIHQYAKKMKPGSHIACITSPTQWPNEDKSVNYHDYDLVKGVSKQLKLVRRAICPYSTQQYNGNQVEIAKDGKLWLVISRTLLVWKRVSNEKK